MSHPGWIALWRKFAEHELWKERRVYSKAEAWIDLLMNANFEDKPAMDGTIVGRGTLRTSTRALSKEWGWSQSGVCRFLKRLERVGMTDSQVTHQAVHLRILNYEQYQRGGGDPDSPLTQERLTNRLTGGLPPSHTLPPSKKQLTRGRAREESKLFGKFFAATETAYATILADWGQSKLAYYVAQFDAYIDENDSRLRKYKNHVAVIRNWERRDAEEGKGFHKAQTAILEVARPIPRKRFTPPPIPSEPTDEQRKDASALVAKLCGQATKEIR